MSGSYDITPEHLELIHKYVRLTHKLMRLAPSLYRDASAKARGTEPPQLVEKNESLARMIEEFERHLGTREWPEEESP